MSLSASSFDPMVSFDNLVELTAPRSVMIVGASTTAATLGNTTVLNVLEHSDFDGDIYGQVIKVEYMNWLRPNRPFDSVEELIATVRGNIRWVRENL